MKIYALLLLCGLSAVHYSCTTGKKSLREHKGSYLESAKLNFEAGEEALKKSEYDKAITYFQFVRSKYPFSKYASLSDLKIADVKFEQKKWLDAAAAYEVFIRLHPRHEQVAFASYRVGSSYFNAIPSSFFLWPSPIKRDQTFTKDALSAVERFIVQFPSSEYIADALQKQKLLFSYLAKHDQYIAGYYKRRARYLAAINRYLEVDTLYPETQESAESLYLAAELYENNLHDLENAMALYKRIMEQKQSSPFVEKARVRLDAILSKSTVNESPESSEGS